MYWWDPAAADSARSPCSVRSPDTPAANSCPALASAETIPFSPRMTALVVALLASLRATIRSRLELGAEVLALRHQLAVLQRTTPRRPRLRPVESAVLVLLSSMWPNWRRAMQIVTPATVVSWHRRAFVAYWRWKSRPRRVDPPALAPDFRALIRQMREANPLWGAPRIYGELQKLHMDVARSSYLEGATCEPLHARLSFTRHPHDLTTAGRRL